jgi:hypothetical protein
MPGDSGHPFPIDANVAVDAALAQCPKCRRDSSDSRPAHASSLPSASIPESRPDCIGTKRSAVGILSGFQEIRGHPRFQKCPTEEIRGHPRFQKCPTRHIRNFLQATRCLDVTHAGMTTARSLLVDPDTPGFYHCISRCVRRAWLFGVDPDDGKSYEHRRAWVEQRLLELAEIFAVGVYAYAVMSNHVHVVLRIDPTTAATWTDEEVATRWVRLFPATVNGAPDETGCRTKEQTLLGNVDRLITCRQRLGSLAWFMKAPNEPIARRANREDACAGRFWGRFLLLQNLHSSRPCESGRYKCQALLDDAAVLTCMSYVDLNPIRAGIAENLESSVHTSAVERIEKVRSNPSMATMPLASINASMGAYLPITTQDYLELIGWSARLTRADKRGSVDVDEPPILRKLGLTEHQWHHQMLGTETRYW